MVMRQRPGGSTTSRPRPVQRQTYQDIQPTSEWKQEEGCAVLVVHLSGFTREQLGIQLQNMDRLRVRGTRLARANTWIRFDQTFPIPEDCTASGIQAKFEDGILYVTFQKKKKDITQVASEEKQAKPTQQTPLSPPKPTGEVKDSIPTKPSPSIIGPDQQKDEKHSQFPSPQQVSPPTASTSGGDGKRVEAPSKQKSETEMNEESDRLKQTTSTTQGKSQTEAKSMEALAKLKSPEDEDTNLGKASTPSVEDNIQTATKNTEALSSEKALSTMPEAKKGGEDQREVSSTSKGSKNAEHVVGKATAGEDRGKTNHDDMEKPTATEKSEEALGKALDQKQTESSEKMGKESKLTAESSAENALGKALDQKQTESSEKMGKESKLTAESSAENALGKALDQKQTESSEKMGKESKLTAESSAENALGKALDQKQTEGSEKIGKESNLTAEDVIQKRAGKEKMDESANGLDQKAAIDKYSNATKIGRTTKNAGEGYAYGKYKQILKEFITPKDEEERKLLINIGMAALVIVAVGAYITYSHWSSAKPRNQ